MLQFTGVSFTGAQEMSDRIEVDPRRCGGSPVVKGTRIPVAVILDHLAAGESWESLLDGYPELSREDIEAALRYAKASIELTEIVPTVANLDAGLSRSDVASGILRSYFATEGHDV